LININNIFYSPNAADILGPYGILAKSIQKDISIKMNNTLIGVLGSRLDHAGFHQKRWQRWRPSVSVLMHPALRIDHYVLLYLPIDEPLLALTLADIATIAPETRVQPICMHIQDPWNLEEVYGVLLDIARGLQCDIERNNYYVNITTGTHVTQICLFLLNEAHYLPGKLLQLSPSKDDIAGTYHVIDLDLSQYDQIASRFARESADAVELLKGGIATRSHTFNALITQLEQVAVRSKAPILLQGPTGAGKSQLAKRIYQLKKHRGQLHGPLIEVNCATLRGDNAMSALFGHVKGAFTGANQSRLGLLREANQGLLFLDEIAELGLDEQAMLLRAIEDKQFMPLGGDHLVTSDFQLIAGSHQDLFERVQAGLFREDLLARINLWTYQLPSLRERLEDLEPNITHELEKFSRTAGHKVDFNQAARQQYLQFAHTPAAIWRANFRDLNSSITRMATLADGGRITEALVAQEIGRLRHSWQRFLPPDLAPAFSRHASVPEQNVGQNTWQNDRQNIIQQTWQNYEQTAVPNALQNAAPKAGLTAEIERNSLALCAQFLSRDQIDALDLFDLLQLAQVLQICMQASSLAEAGRLLFAQSRLKKSASNDSHRLKQYLAKYQLDFQYIKAAKHSASLSLRF
jgi:transcriptional regulatory protein RtcR